MALTLAYQSALDVIRMLRAQKTNVGEMDHSRLARPKAWVGKRFGKQNFDPSVWRWPAPLSGRALHVLIPKGCSKLYAENICCHINHRDLPAGSIYWLDEYASMVCPELLFLQMVETLSLPMLVMLGHELCGHFTRDWENPLEGDVVDGIPAVTSVAMLEDYLSKFKYARGLVQAKQALQYVRDHAISAPEAALATMYMLPPEESGYGFGSITLNERVEVAESGVWVTKRHRYPDLTFSMAPVGINYDGSKHLDLVGLVDAAITAAHADDQSRSDAYEALNHKLDQVRAKVTDDNLRNRQLAAQGRIVFPVTKEDLYGPGRLDDLSRQLLGCMREVFGVDTTEHEKVLEDTTRASDRQDLLHSLLPFDHSGISSYGKM